MNAPRVFLIIAAIGLTPIALSYGFDPVTSLNYLFGITIQGVNDTHIFRAIMGLYLSLVAFWLLGAMCNCYTSTALYSLVVFMFGLAIGRGLSHILDGLPHIILSIYMILEIGFGVIGIMMIKKIKRAEEAA